MRSLLIILSLFIAGSLVTSCTHERFARTSSARAAYGDSVPFSTHTRKNEKARKKAKRSAKQKKFRNTREGYRRGLPI